MIIEGILSIKGTPLAYILYSFLISIIAVVFLSSIFRALIKHLGEKLSFFGAMAVVYASQVMNLFIPFKVGALLGKPLFSRVVYKIPVKKGTFAMVFEHFFQVCWQLTLFIILIVIIGKKVLFKTISLQLILFGVIIFLFFFVLVKRKWITKIIMKIKLLKKLRLNEVMAMISEYPINKRLIITLLVFTLLYMWFPPLYLVFGSKIVGVFIPFLTLFSMYWISYLVGRLSILPSGLGLYDLTMAGLLVAYGISLVDATKIILLFRGLSMLPYIVIGGALILYWGNKFTFKKFLFKRDSSFIIEDSGQKGSKPS